MRSSRAAIARRPRARVGFRLWCRASRRALAPHFERVIGVDLSASMIETARALKQTSRTSNSRESFAAPRGGRRCERRSRLFEHDAAAHSRAPRGRVRRGVFRVLAPGGVAVSSSSTARRQHARKTICTRLQSMAQSAAPAGVAPSRRLRDARAREATGAGAGRHPELRIALAFDDPSAGPGWRGLRWYVVREARCGGPGALLSRYTFRKPQECVRHDPLIAVRRTSVSRLRRASAGRGFRRRRLKQRLKPELGALARESPSTACTVIAPRTNRMPPIGRCAESRGCTIRWSAR